MQYLRFLKRGWTWIIAGILAILFVGFVNPTADALDLAFRYSLLHISAITAIAVGIILELDT